MVFFTLYLQLLGMSDFAASLLMAVFLGGTAVGEFVHILNLHISPGSREPVRTRRRCS